MAESDEVTSNNNTASINSNTTIDYNKWADYWYDEMGMNIIPADTKNKRTYEKWSQWQITPIPRELFEEWKATNRFADGIGVIVGKSWRGVREGKYLIFVDCDNKKAIDEFCTKDGKTKTLQQTAEIFLIEQHRDNPNKAHIFFFSEDWFPKKSSDVLERALVKENEEVDVPLFEIKGKGSHGIAYVTPSLHKDGYRYEILGTRTPIVLDKSNAEIMKQHLDSICRKYDLHYLENVDTSGNTNKTPVASLFEDDFGIPAGQNRHVAMLGLMDSLIYYAKKHEIRNLKILRKVADEINEGRCKPPLDEKEMDKLWKQAGEFIQMKHPDQGTGGGVVGGGWGEANNATTIPLKPEEQKQVEQREILYSKLIHEFRQPVHHLPVIPLAQLGMDYGDTPVVVTGSVVGLSTLVPDWTMIKFVCKACNQANKSDIHDESKPPSKCRFCESNQGFVTQVDWNIQPRLNRQTILIQDGSESLPCILSGTQQEMWPVKPGQKVQALGIQRYETFYNARAHRQDWLKYFKLLDIKPMAGLDVKVIEQDAKYFHDLATLPKYRFIEDILIPSFAPHITGKMDEAKLVCVYTLASQGLERPFNSMILGPPARGKTELVQYSADLSYYGNLTTFINASVAGLTTETRRDPISGMAMAVPGILATFSMACFTDLNGAIHHSEGKKLLLGLNDALERKVATSGKAGGAQSFEARSAVLMDSNNHAGSWYYDESLQSNMNFLPRSFLSRIDMAAIIPEKVTDEHFGQVADANYDSYRQKQNAIKLHEGDWTDEETGAPRLGFESLRKFFFYICQQPLPELPDDKEVKQYFRQNYQKIAKQSYEYLFDGRYNRTVLILARVRARLLLKKVAEKSELDHAIGFINNCKHIEVIIPKTGEKDGNYLVGSQSKVELKEEEDDSLQQWIIGCKTAMEQSEYMSADGVKYFTKNQLADILKVMPNSQWLERDKIWTYVDRFENEKKMASMDGAEGKRLYTWLD